MTGSVQWVQVAPNAWVEIEGRKATGRGIRRVGEKVYGYRDGVRRLPHGAYTWPEEDHVRATTVLECNIKLDQIAELATRATVVEHVTESLRCAPGDLALWRAACHR